MNELVDEALGTGKLFKAGNRSVGDGDGNGFSHGLVQCTRDKNGTELLKNVDGESPSLLPGKEKSFRSLAEVAIYGMPTTLLLNNH